MCTNGYAGSYYYVSIEGDLILAAGKGNQYAVLSAAKVFPFKTKWKIGEAIQCYDVLSDDEVEIGNLLMNQVNRILFLIILSWTLTSGKDGKLLKIKDGELWADNYKVSNLGGHKADPKRKLLHLYALFDKLHVLQNSPAGGWLLLNADLVVNNKQLIRDKLIEFVKRPHYGEFSNGKSCWPMESDYKFNTISMQQDKAAFFRKEGLDIFSNLNKGWKFLEHRYQRFMETDWLGQLVEILRWESIHKSMCIWYKRDTRLEQLLVVNKWTNKLVLEAKRTYMGALLFTLLKRLGLTQWP